MVKAAATRANHRLGLLTNDKAEAIQAACAELIRGEYHDQFIVDLILGGAGTSTNMNANEVIANIGLAKLGYEKGEYKHLHPNNDVNRSQSTNDVYPTASRLAIVFAAQALKTVLADLQRSLAEKSQEFASILKMGHTQLQDAVPMSLGQEFEAFAINLGEENTRIDEVCLLLCEINLGGTAIDTGINAPHDYAALAINELVDISGLKAKNLIAASYDMGDFVSFSSVLKRLSIKLSKLSNDLRLLSNGPRTGLGEINLPAMQPGSSIIPGKVNPVIPEAMNQTAFQVMGSDITITLAAEAGQLQLNAMEPLIIYNLLNNCRMLDKLCIRGITANEGSCTRHVEQSIGIITALVPHIGYDNANRIAGLALLSRKGVVELVFQEQLLSDEALADILSPKNMVR